jgi:hypothetical protein
VVIVNTLSRVIVPMLPSKKMSPVPLLSVSEKPPWTVWLKVMSPAAGPVFRVVSAPSVMGLAKEIPSFVVTIVLPSETPPVPF